MRFRKLVRGEQLHHAAVLNAVPDRFGRVEALCGEIVYDAERLEAHELGGSGFVTCHECRPLAENIRPIEHGERAEADAIYGAGNGLAVVYPRMR